MAFKHVEYPLKCSCCNCEGHEEVDGNCRFCGQTEAEIQEELNGPLEHDEHRWDRFIVLWTMVALSECYPAVSITCQWHL